MSDSYVIEIQYEINPSFNEELWGIYYSVGSKYFKILEDSLEDS